MALPATLSVLLTQSAAEEGRKVIISMLVVGLLFVSVIALGETTRWLRHRRKR